MRREGHADLSISAMLAGNVSASIHQRKREKRLLLRLNLLPSGILTVFLA
jgi:hypothetical protein